MDKASLIQWFELFQRSFPWREDRTPYRVWISETMLQQTRAPVVVDYFLRWMQRFPSIKDLSSADFAEVLKAWEGLGYYSRARNLHLGAKQIVEKYNGKIPDSFEELLSIQGIGPYTACAILAFAFQKHVVAVDGNVKRVIARHKGIETDLIKNPGKKELEQAAEELASEGFSWKVSEALIELGAMVCTPNPQCEKCPIIQGCRAHKEGKQRLIPWKKPKKPVQKIQRAALIFESKNALLLRQNEKGKIMADLHEFPYLELKDSFSKDKVVPYCEKTLKISMKEAEELDSISHGFTTYQVEIFPFYIKCSNQFPTDLGTWYSLSDIANFSFSSGHRRILQQLFPELSKVDL